jgi:hypothetical protein
MIGSHDVDVELRVGDRVHGLLELEIVLPADRSIVAWMNSLKTADLEHVWNGALEAKGETGRVAVTSFRLVEGSARIGNVVGPYGARSLIYSFEVVGTVTKNPLPILAWALVAVLVAVLADVTLNGAKVLTATGKAIGTTLAAIVAPVAKAAGSLALYLGAAAALLLGVYLWAR